jgi:hypothetical protein
MNSNAMNALMSQAETYVTQRDFDRAAAIVHEAKKLEPQSIEPDAMMASLALHLGKLDEAAVRRRAQVLRARDALRS